MMGTPPASRVMAEILTALHDLTSEQPTPVSEAEIAAHVRIPAKLVRHHLISMERLGLVRRAGNRGRERTWLLAELRL